MLSCLSFSLTQSSPSFDTIKEFADCDADSDCGNSVESVTSITSEMISEIGSEFQSKVRS